MTISSACAQRYISLHWFLLRRDLNRVQRDLCSTIDSFFSISVQPGGPEGQDCAEQMLQNPRLQALRRRLSFDQPRLANISLAFGL